MRISNAGIARKRSELEWHPTFDAVLAWGNSKARLVRTAELGITPKAASNGNVQDWELGLSNQTPGAIKSNIQIVSYRRQSGVDPENPVQLTLRQGNSLGNISDAKRLFQITLHENYGVT